LKQFDNLSAIRTFLKLPDLKLGMYICGERKQEQLSFPSK